MMLCASNLSIKAHEKLIFAVGKIKKVEKATWIKKRT